jgi:hypothetical protein
MRTVVAGEVASSHACTAVHLSSVGTLHHVIVEPKGFRTAGQLDYCTVLLTSPARTLSGAHSFLTTRTRYCFVFCSCLQTLSHSILRSTHAKQCTLTYLMPTCTLLITVSNGLLGSFAVAHRWDEQLASRCWPSTSARNAACAADSIFWHPSALNYHAVAERRYQLGLFVTAGAQLLQALFLITCLVCLIKDRFHHLAAIL